MASYWARSLRMVRMMIIATMHDMTTTTITEFTMLNQCTCTTTAGSLKPKPDVTVQSNLDIQYGLRSLTNRNGYEGIPVMKRTVASRFDCTATKSSVSEDINLPDQRTRNTCKYTQTYTFDIMSSVFGM